MIRYVPSPAYSSTDPLTSTLDDDVDSPCETTPASQRMSPYYVLKFVRLNNKVMTVG